MSSKRQIIALLCLCAVSITAYFGFSSVTDAVLVEGASVFVVPTVWFFLTLTLFSVGTIIWNERAYQGIACLVLVLPSFFFTPTITHAAIITIAGLFVFTGILRIGRELSERIRFSVYRSVFVGMSQIIFALSLVISSQYYVHINTFSWDRLVPSFDMAEGMGAWMLRIAGTVSPSLATLQKRNLSVDDFLQELRPVVEIGGVSGTLGQSIAEVVRQAEITRSKTELSRLLGREVNGGESMDAILSEVLRKKLIAFVSARSAGNTPPSVPFLPFFLSALLFFTIYPFGSLVAPLALFLTTVFYKLLVQSGFLVLKKVPTEREVLV